MTRKASFVVVVVVAAVVLLLSQTFCSADEDSASAAVVPPTVTTWTAHPGGLTTFRTTGTAICPEHPNGVLAGWIISHEEKAWPSGILQYRFGDWAGIYCSNGRKIWGVIWGGEPPCWANWAILWACDDERTHIRDQHLKGTYRWREWVTRTHTKTPVIQRVDHPWLHVNLGLFGNITQSHGCGC